MDELGDGKKSKDRSPTFPFITLEQALERARQFYGEEKRGVAPFTRAVLHWHYSQSSSGGLQTVAALKSYGLMIEPGGTGKGRQLQLSDLALRILLDQRPDSAERKGYIRQAAAMPAVASEVYSKWRDSLPSDSTLNHFLVLEKKFTEGTALKTIKILKENQQFAGADDSVVSSSRIENDGDEMISEGGQIQPREGADVPRAPRTNTATARNPATAAHMEQLLHLDGKTTITIHFSDTPTADLYKWVSAFATFKAEQLAQSSAAASSTAEADEKKT